MYVAGGNYGRTPKAVTSFIPSWQSGASDNERIKSPVKSSNGRITVDCPCSAFSRWRNHSSATIETGGKGPAENSLPKGG
ncbi:MAG: hypothetical protein JW712_13865 [Dehalococcoidales bacterium]|nr:hypothetical protein [Dehalococcoidales bacterium]